MLAKQHSEHLLEPINGGSWVKPCIRHGLNVHCDLVKLQQLRARLPPPPHPPSFGCFYRCSAPSAMHGRTAGVEDLPPHLAAAIIRQAFDRGGRQLLPWLQLSLVSRHAVVDASLHVLVLHLGTV